MAGGSTWFAFSNLASGGGEPDRVAFTSFQRLLTAIDLPREFRPTPTVSLSDGPVSGRPMREAPAPGLPTAGRKRPSSSDWSARC